MSDGVIGCPSEGCPGLRAECARAGADCPHHPHHPHHPRPVWLRSLALPGHPRRVWLHSHVLLGCPHVVGVVEDPESPCLDAQALLCGDHWVPQCHAGGFQLVIHVLQPCCHDGDSVHQLLVHCWESSPRWWLSRPCAVAGTDCPHQPYHPRSVWLCSLVLLGHPRTVWLCSCFARVSRRGWCGPRWRLPIAAPCAPTLLSSW